MLELFLVFGGIVVISIIYSCFKVMRSTDEEIIAELVEESCFVNKFSNKKPTNTPSEVKGN